MAVRKTIYILLFVITMYIGLMYNKMSVSVLLAFEVFLYLVLFVSSFVIKKSITVSIKPIDSVVETAERAKAAILVKNDSFLPVTNAMLRLRIKNRLDAESETYDMNLRVPARGSVRIPFRFESTYCGVVKIELEQIETYDYLQLFRRRKKVTGACECVIMPRLHEMQVMITEACRNFDSDSEEYDKHKPGDDPSEIFAIREYRQGDKMSRVHWKMTARLDTMMVKEFSRPVSNSVGIFLDLRYHNIEEAQAVFELCYSLSMALLANECKHCIFWCRNTQQIQFEELTIGTPEDITEGMGKLLTFGKRTDRLCWDEFCNAYKDLAIHRMIAITCMDPERDLEEFHAPSQMIKTVLTIDKIQELVDV